MKHFFLLILAAVSFFTSVSRAQVPGTWNVHPVFAAPPQGIISAGKFIYYLSGGGLFSYDRDGQESRSFTRSNFLSDHTVTGIYYDAATDCLLVAYASGNIDLLYGASSGDLRLVNMSDIRDSSVAPPLTITGVCFTPGRIYVATVFGLVEFDATAHHVTRSGIYNTEVTAITPVSGGNILLWADGSLRMFKPGGKINKITDLRDVCPYTKPMQLVTAQDSLTVLVGISTWEYNVAKIRLDESTMSPYDFTNVATYPTAIPLYMSADGKARYISERRLCEFDPSRDTAPKERMSLPDDFLGAVALAPDGMDEVWTLTREGLACHGFEGGTTQYVERFRPEEFSVREVCHMVPTADGRKLYFLNNGTTAYRYSVTPAAEAYNTQLNVAVAHLTQGDMTDATPYPVKAHTPVAQERQTYRGEYILSPTALATDPDNENAFYVSSSVDGVYYIKDGVLKGHYDETNSPLRVYDSRLIAYHVSVDRGGNLWVQTTTAGGVPGVVLILPAAKRKLPSDQVRESDWVVPSLRDAGLAPGQDILTLHCRRSNISFIANHNNACHFAAYDNRGTLSDFSDDRFKVWTQLTDQDGNIFNPNRRSAICEDRDGAVWIGTDQGVIVIQNPASALSESMTVRRVKVPKNDGTGTAEYLLSTDMIYSIAADASNRKWIATKASGLFLVSADGSEILANYTKDNSPLPSNCVYTVATDPFSSTVYVGTAEGLFTFASDASPAMESFDDITVYPNPVRPDYYGDIYVKGLMEGALVKITDSAGRVLVQGRSEGGQFSWDGRTPQGARVPSGVYYVMASQPSGGSAGGTAKFMIIR